MSTSFSTDLLLKKLDRVKPDLKPLPTHYIASQDQHTRELYATMLAAVMLAKGQVTEPETRLFGMLLQSMKIEATTAKFFELAQQIDENQLKRFFIDISETKESFLLDSIVLARLSDGLSESQSRLFAEILDILNVKKSSKLLKTVNFAMGFKTGLDAKELEMSLINRSPILIDAWNEFLVDSGVWTDPATGLMWTRYSLGQTFSSGEVKGVASKYSAFSEVEGEIAKVNDKKSIAGLSDWRVPSFDEIEKFMISGGAGYNKNAGDFLKPNSNEFGCFWTSETQSLGIWHVRYKNINFDKGGADFKDLSMIFNPKDIAGSFVRLVHGKQVDRKK